MSYLNGILKHAGTYRAYELLIHVALEAANIEPHRSQTRISPPPSFLDRTYGRTSLAIVAIVQVRIYSQGRGGSSRRVATKFELAKHLQSQILSVHICEYTFIYLTIFYNAFFTNVH